MHLHICPYPSDLSDHEWEILAPLIPPAKPGGRPRKWPMREILDAIFYLLRSGCQWRMLPRNFPPWSTVHHYFRLWRLDGTWEKINALLRERIRLRGGRDPQPSAGILDTQSVKTTTVGGSRGYDGAKKLSGRKRHLLVDTLGMMLKANVHTADLQDRAAVPLVLEGAAEEFLRLEHLWVDQGYTGTGKKWIEEHLGWSVEVVKHPQAARRVATTRRHQRSLHRLFRVGSTSTPAEEISRPSTEALGSRANHRLAFSEQEDEQRLRAAVREQSSDDLRGYGSPDAKEARPCLTLLAQLLETV